MFGYKLSIYKYFYHLIIFFIFTGNMVLATNPVGGDTSVTILEDQDHTFAENEFPFSDSDGHSFAGIQIITTESAGAFERLCGPFRCHFGSLRDRRPTFRSGFPPET